MAKIKTKAIRYNADIDRLLIGTHEVRCGEPVRVKLPMLGWVDTRVERGEQEQGHEGWHLVGYDIINPVGLPAEVNI